MATRDFLSKYRHLRRCGWGAAAAYSGARAWVAVEDRGWSYRWEDDDGDDGHDDWCRARRCKGHTVLGCVLVDADDRPLASLWGIIDPDASYEQEIQIELAMEALADVEELEAQETASVIAPEEDWA